MYTLVRILTSLIDFYSVLIVVYCLMSWIPRSSEGIIEDIRSVLASLCEPYLSLFRRFIPPLMMIDFSPIVAIIVLELLSMVIRSML